ncbi:MAG: hypothetical protein H0V62_12265 [Gammaproteobacteria bacterium]|nr:hypothetical protein [Gammaproteobacteria bacterium]MBA3731483.1 hypothetical protein [Gammaproteobacteria bacterium]
MITYVRSTRSPAQRARVLTELWAERNVLCPFCSKF